MFSTHTARALLITCVASLGGGCVDAETDEDARDDAFLAADEKSDANGVSENSPEARGVLRVANELTRSQLRNDVGLSAAAASNIVIERAGPDEIAGNADDTRFTTLTDLDSVPYVGSIAFDKMLAYATSRGWVVPATAALPGPACEGQLTGIALWDLLAQKPITGTPASTGFTNGYTLKARKLGPWTSGFYSRTCDSETGCSDWTPAVMPRAGYGQRGFMSIMPALRAGDAYLWNDASNTLTLGLYSKVLGTGCHGWVQGLGTVVRDGDNAKVTVAATEASTCTGSYSPFYQYEGRDLHDPAGIVTDHCLKLSFTQKTLPVQVAPGRYRHNEYVVVYDATY